MIVLEAYLTSKVWILICLAVKVDQAFPFNYLVDSWDLTTTCWLEQEQCSRYLETQPYDHTIPFIRAGVMYHISWQLRYKDTTWHSIIDVDTQQRHHFKAGRGKR